MKKEKCSKDNLSEKGSSDREQKSEQFISFLINVFLPEFSWTEMRRISSGGLMAHHLLIGTAWLLRYGPGPRDPTDIGQQRRRQRKTF